MSIRYAREVNPICGDCFASVATRCCFVDTVLEFRCIRRVSLQRFHDPTPRFPPRGPGGPVPALHRYYQGATTSCRPFRRASFPSLGGTTRCVCLSLPSPPDAVAMGREFFGFGDPHDNRLCRWKRQDLPSSWETPSAAMPGSSTPVGRPAPHQIGVTAWPPRGEQR